MRVYNLIYPCFLILGMESKQCPKCMEVDQHLNFPKIPMEKHELAIKQFGVTSYGGCPNVMCNMKLVSTDFNGKTKLYTLTWKCDTCEHKAIERNMKQHYYESAVKIGRFTPLTI